MTMTIEGMTLNGYKIVLQNGKKEMERVCPNCYRMKPISQFGLRCFQDKKEIRLQSHCEVCRAEAAK